VGGDGDGRNAARGESVGISATAAFGDKLKAGRSKEASAAALGAASRRHRPRLALRDIKGDNIATSALAAPRRARHRRAA